MKRLELNKLIKEELIKILNEDDSSEDLSNYGIKELRDGLTIDIIKSKLKTDWILRAEIKDVILGLNNSGLVWYDGTFEGGEWWNGTWKNGTFENGTWIDGTWKDGTWENGVWKDGMWENGTWENGTFGGGIWKDGTWKGGNFKSRNWLNGVWEDDKNPHPKER